MVSILGRSRGMQLHINIPHTNSQRAANILALFGGAYVAGAEVVTMNEHTGPDPSEVAASLKLWMRNQLVVPAGQTMEIPDDQAGRASAAKLADVMDQACVLNIRGTKACDC